MKNFDFRISKLEKDVQYMEDDNNPCYGFTFPEDATDENIMNELKITAKEFSKWKKFRNNSNELVILSPNFQIDKFILQLNK